MNMTPRERIAKAGINLLTDYPFFGNLTMKLVPRELSEEEQKKYGIQAMAVDIYGNLLYSPQGVAQQSDVILKCALVHEVMHLALKHLQRIGTRQPFLWNIATDAAVNDILNATFKIPHGWVLIPEMKGKSAEEIYDWLIRNAEKAKQYAAAGFDKHIFGTGENGNGSGQSPFYQEGQLPFDAERAVREAWNFAKTQGKTPAGIERYFKDILNPQLDWKDILRRFIVETIPHDFSYTRPHKKSQSTGFYMPVIKREEVNLVIAVDSSGSISDEEYAEFLSEIYALVRQFEGIKATLIICDCEIKEVMEIDETFDPYSVHGRGYGGTSSIPVYNYIEENIGEHNVKLLVYFTDGWIDIPDKEYPFPTLWIVSKRGRTDEVERMPNSIVIQIPKDSTEDDY